MRRLKWLLVVALVPLAVGAFATTSGAKAQPKGKATSSKCQLAEPTRLITLKVTNPGTTTGVFQYSDVNGVAQNLPLHVLGDTLTEAVSWPSSQALAGQLRLDRGNAGTTVLPVQVGACFTDLALHSARIVSADCVPGASTRLVRLEARTDPDYFWQDAGFEVHFSIGVNPEPDGQYPLPLSGGDPTHQAVAVPNSELRVYSFTWPAATPLRVFVNFAADPNVGPDYYVPSDGFYVPPCLS